MELSENDCEILKKSLTTKSSNSNTKDDIFFLYNNFLRSNDTHLFNFMMSRHEILKKTIDMNLSGSFAEFGIMKCTFSFQIMKTLLMNNINKNFYIFDFFDEDVNINNTNECEQIKEIYERTNYKRMSVNEVLNYSKNLNFNNLKCIKGNVENTLLPFLNNNADRFCFVYIDLDVENPTHFVLENIFNRVVKNGIIIIDDYNSEKWGPFVIIDEFLKNKNVKINNLHNTIKTGLIIQKLD